MDGDGIGRYHKRVRYDEFRRCLGKAGITAKEYAELIKLRPASITNYAKKGHVPSHLAVIVTLMGELAENGLDFRAALSRLDLERNKPRGSAAKGRFGGTKQIALALSHQESVGRGKGR